MAGGGVALLACTKTSAPFRSPLQLVPTVSVSSPWYSPDQSKAVDRISRALGEALGRPEARAALLSALRASRYSEHQVRLSDFLSGPHGRLVAREALQLPPYEDLEVLAASLPPIDMYLPHRAHRRTWRASASIAVAALLDRSSPMVGYLSGGSVLPLDRWSTDAPPTAVLLLGPAEATILGADNATPPDTGVIDAELPAPQRMECTEETCDDGSGGGGPPINPALFLDAIETYHICDNGYCGETNEFEFRAWDSNGFFEFNVRCEGIPSTGLADPGTWPYCTTTRVHWSTPEEVPFIDVEVRETDGGIFGGSDDFFLDWITNYPNAAAMPRVTLIRSGFLLYENSIAGFLCDPPSPGGNLFCDKVQVRFRW